MTREERLDWLCRLRSEIYVYMPYEWLKPMDEALTDSIKALEQEPMREFTEEEANAYSKALDKMYKPTGYNVFDEPCEDIERKIEKEYLFESLCEDLKKLQAENDNLRNALEQEHILDKIRAEIDQYLFRNEFGSEYRKEVSQIIDKYRQEG